MNSRDIVYEPALVEDVVRRGMEARSEDDPVRSRYRRELDETYTLAGLRRLTEVQRVQRAVFNAFDWPPMFETLLAGLLNRLSAAAVFRSERDEGCFLDDRRRLQIRIRSSRFDDRDALKCFLRHELVHVSDMLDPAFGYREAELDEPTRLRFAALWCGSIEARLKGGASEPVTHAALLDRARAQSSPRCPLCSLPTSSWGKPTPALAERIHGHYPQWRPDQGICDRCLEWAEVVAKRG